MTILMKQSPYIHIPGATIDFILYRGIMVVFPKSSGIQPLPAEIAEKYPVEDEWIMNLTEQCGGQEYPPSWWGRWAGRTDMQHGEYQGPFPSFSEAHKSSKEDYLRCKRRNRALE